MLNQTPMPSSPADEARRQAADSRYIMLIFIWVFFLVSALGIVMVTIFVPPRSDVPPENNPVLVYSMLLPALVTAFLSFVVKRKLLDRAMSSGKLQAAQSAHIIGLALCEACTLIGVALAFATRSPLAYVPMAVGFVCLLLHKPKRDDLSVGSSNMNG